MALAIGFIVDIDIYDDYRIRGAGDQAIRYILLQDSSFYVKRFNSL